VRNNQSNGIKHEISESVQDFVSFNIRTLQHKSHDKQATKYCIF